MQKIHFSTLALLALLLSFGCRKEATETQNGEAASDRGAITLPAGSVNQLQAAVDNYVTVILAPGTHTETGMVVVSGKHHIVGQPGAVLVMTTPPSVDLSLPIPVALHFHDAAGSLIKNVKIESALPIGGCAILLEDSENAVVENCEITDFQYGIFVEQSPSVRIAKNTLAISTGWQTGDIPEAHGIVIINGDHAVVEDNEVSGAVFGIWPCDKNGVCRKNTVHENYIGIILCKVPADAIKLPDGSTTGAQFSCQYWTVRNNNSHNNFGEGYLVIDGANHNFLDNNAAANNGTYDYELTGDTYRFGFLTPFAFDNTVKAGEGQTVKDCGVNNTVIGGIQIDTNVDLCY